jgi:hypothetical protein
MVTLTGTDLQVPRTRFAAALATHLERHAGRPHWDAGQLASCQRERLRTLLARAIAQSPFHARRLAGIDPGRFELADLARLPVMTKEQMMAGSCVQQSGVPTCPMMGVAQACRAATA